MDYVQALDDIFSTYTGPQFGFSVGSTFEKCYGAGDNPAFTLVLASPHTVKRLLAEGAIGFGESYMDGTLDITGSLDAYLKLRHEFKHLTPSFRFVLAKWWAGLTSPRQRDGQISYHYDLGNDFFSLFLDTETMSYSAGVFHSPKDTLVDAQKRKLSLVTDWVPLPAAAQVLDLGSGWAGFAAHAAAEAGWCIDGVTLSETQYQYSVSLVSERSLTNQIQITKADFTTLRPTTRYDGVVMIEALEHVGKQELGQFMSGVAACLSPGGKFYLQFTGRYTPKPVDPWTLKYVFPGGYLPAKSEVEVAATAAGFHVERFEDNTHDYIYTMTKWIEGLETNQKKIEDRYGTSFFRLWKLWTHGARVSFELGDMNLFRVLLTKK